MIEQIIYWTGVTALLSISLTAICFCLWLLLRGFSKLLWTELKKNYHLMQLNYFMGQLERNGLAVCVDNMNKNKDAKS